jgi:PhoPQ-activated pathogenicity-related protein
LGVFSSEKLVLLCKLCSLLVQNDPTQSGKSEDAIIAWTWNTFITTHQDQPEVILRMPMTKVNTSNNIIPMQ